LLELARRLKTKNPVFIAISEQKKKKAKPLWKALAFEMVPIIGFELMTYRLQGGCSTN
jgi:hypothetical protein